MTACCTTSVDTEEREAIAMYGRMMDGWGPWFMSINTLVVIVLLMGAAVAVYQFAQRPVGQRPTMSRAEQVLAERYARGEIDRTEFEERRATIKGVES
jgi:putative membrane protein